MLSVVLSPSLHALQQLDQYQEQAYLLDPYLEELVNPVMEEFKQLVRAPDSARNDSLCLLSLVLYHYIKFRGYKSISSFLPVIEPHVELMYS